MDAALILGLLALLPEVVALLDHLRHPHPTPDTTTPEEGNR